MCIPPNPLTTEEFLKPLPSASPTETFISDTKLSTHFVKIQQFTILNPVLNSSKQIAALCKDICYLVSCGGSLVTALTPSIM